MGIKDLKKYLAYARKSYPITSYFKNKRVGLDASVWLHELVVVHGYETVMNGNYKGVARDFVWRVQQLVANGATMLVILDGMRATAKSGTNLGRNSRSKRKKQRRRKNKIKTNRDIKKAKNNQYYFFTF